MHRSNGSTAGVCLGAVLASALLGASWSALADLPKYYVQELGLPNHPEWTEAGFIRYAYAVGLNASGSVIGDAGPGLVGLMAFRYQGGETSLISGNAWTVDINNAGQVLTVVWDELGTRTTVIGADGISAQIPGLGEFSNGPVWGAAINDHGQVTGARFPEPGSGGGLAFLYSDGNVIDIPNPRPPGLDPFVDCYGTDLNDKGYVVGSCGGTLGSFVFLFDGTSTTDMGSGASVLQINESGQVLFSGSLYTNGTITELGTLGGAGGASGKALSDSGLVTGSASTASGETHAFLYSTGEMLDLGTLGGDWSEGVAINDRGEVAGSSTLSSGYMRAFIYADGSMINLGALGRENSVAVDINEHGQVAGTVFDGAGWWQGDERTRAFLATPIALMFTRLSDAVVGVGPGNKLASNVRTANHYYNSDDFINTCAALDRFAGQVARDTGDRKNQVPANQSAELISDAVEIKAAVGCP